jgi:hypothetical protein
MENIKINQNDMQKDWIAFRIIAGGKTASSSSET